ncbi:MAG: TolC family protein [bacterium]|nr:TolC family protein [bacterium]
MNLKIRNKKLNKKYLIIIMIIIFTAIPVFSDEPDMAPEAKEGLAAEIKKDKKLKLTVEKVVQYLLRNNHDVKQALLDYKGASSGLLLFQSKYDINLQGSGSHSVTETSPNNPQSTFGGTSTTASNFTLGVNKTFVTGTTLTATVGGTYSNVEGAGTIDMSAFGGPTIAMGGSGYQTNIKLELSQELLKNGLIGLELTDSLEEKREENRAEMAKRAVKMNLALLLTDALVGYWNIAIAEESLATSEENLRSTMNIRNLIRRKMKLGLSEQEDILDWNGKVLSGKNNIENAKQFLFDARLDVLRVLNLDNSFDIEIGKTFTQTAPDIKVEQALKDAFLKRVDWNNKKTALKNAEMECTIAGYNRLPSLKAKAGVGNSDYDTESYLKTFNDLNKEYSVGFAVSYPLGNTAANTRMDNALRGLQKEKIALQKLEKIIRDKIASVVQQCEVKYKIYKQTQKSKVFAQKYYYQVLQKFKRGRYSAVQLKLALDGYIMARQAELQSLVNYNIALIRRDLSRNVIFENLEIDIDGILKRVEG